jgi:hypothetical protein
MPLEDRVGGAGGYDTAAPGWVCWVIMAAPAPDEGRDEKQQA